MKNLLISAAFILSGLLQVQAINTPDATGLTVVENEKSMILNSSYYTSGAEEMTITDKYGEVVFSDVIESNKKRIKYDLKALSSGTYTVRVVNNHIASVYETEVSNNQIEILNTKSYFRPTIDILDGKVSVKAELENREDIRIFIYDNNNFLVFKKNIEKEHSFVQTFNLNQLPAGQYAVIVSSDYFVEQTRVTL